MPEKDLKHSVRSEKLAERRAHIVETAAALFIEKGFHQTGMRDIAGGAGISLGNLYNHFKGKGDIIVAIADVEAEELEPLLRPLEAAGKADPDLLADFVERYFQLTSSPAYAALSAEIIAELFRNPVVAVSFEASRMRLIAAVSSCLPDALGEAEAELVISLVESAGLNAVGKKGPDKDIMLQALVGFVERAVKVA